MRSIQVCMIPWHTSRLYTYVPAAAFPFAAAAAAAAAFAALASFSAGLFLLPFGRPRFRGGGLSPVAPVAEVPPTFEGAAALDELAAVSVVVATLESSSPSEGRECFGGRPFFLGADVGEVDMTWLEAWGTAAEVEVEGWVLGMLASCCCCWGCCSKRRFWR